MPCANNKRIVTILYHPVERKELFVGLGEIQWISYPELGFEPTFQRLITAIDTDLEWVRQHTRFGLRAAQWEANSRDNGFLLHGLELREAIRWLEQAPTIKGQQPTEIHQQYIRASEQWEAGEIQRLKDLNSEKERQARIATARERVAFSTLSLEEDPERSILLAMYAMDATRNSDGIVISEAEDALHRAILRSQVRLTLTGHKREVNAIAVNGRLAVSASEDKTLKVWDMETGHELRTLRGHTGGVHGVALSGHGRLAVSASEDKTLKVWEVETGRELQTLTGHGAYVWGVALSGDGRLAVSCSKDKTLKVWEVETGRELQTLQGHTGGVYGVALSGDGRFAISASEDKTLKMWEVESGRELRTLTGHTGRVVGVAFGRDEREAVSASHDGTLKVWEVETGRELRTLTGHSGRVDAVAVTPDGRLAVSASADRTLKLKQSHGFWFAAACPEPQLIPPKDAEGDKNKHKPGVAPDLPPFSAR